MISLEEIKEKTLWTAYLDDGANITGTSDKIAKYVNGDKTKLELVKAQAQPIELQPFWLSYEYTINELKRDDLVEVDDFYHTWINDPDAFDPENKVSRFALRDLFLLYSHYPKSTSICIDNHDGYRVGSHTRSAWEKALDTLGENTDFNILSYVNDGIDPDYPTMKIIRVVIQSSNLEKLHEFAALANRFGAEERFS